MAIDGAHILVLSMVFKGTGCLFFCSQGAVCGFEKSVGDRTASLVSDSHIFISFSASFSTKPGVHVRPWMRGLDGLIGAGDAVILEVVRSQCVADGTVLESDLNSSVVCRRGSATLRDVRAFFVDSPRT